MPLGAYVHVPFCASRCGYCDFNTYTAAELGGGGARTGYPSVVAQEMAHAEAFWPGGTLDTVFFGGGTPTLLPESDLLGMLHQLRTRFGLTAGAEVTVEANPESVSEESLATLRAGGVTRVSFGMQSAVPSVLTTLDRAHRPGALPQCVSWARRAGFEQVSVDLIYGTPGESMADWRVTVDAALSVDPDHISAYALVVEPGTRMGRAVRSGALATPDDDDLADKYLLADDAFSSAGRHWYEVSNWARTPAQQCRHNLGYWQGGQWWGFGAGAHSGMGTRRWWNVRHPSAYARRLAEGRSPAEAGEDLDAATRHTELVMLRLRTSDGLRVADVQPAEVAAAHQLVAEQLLDAGSLAEGRLVLTVSGRLLADHVIRRLLLAADRQQAGAAR